MISLLIASVLVAQTENKSEKKPAVQSEKSLKKGDKLNENNNPEAIIHTNFGDIRIELFKEKAPISVKNFMRYANESFYDSLIFHRIIPNFMIQGGGFDADGNRKNPTHEPIKNEATNGLSNVKGTIAMARTNQIHSATSQFFINVKNNLFLDHKGPGSQYGYAVFGKVIEGMEVVDEIKNVPTGTNPKYGMKDWPKKDVIIESVEIIN
ncbi:MAG: peptidyl-prolyl cis-trans isomerase [Candidatus Cloacimonetes bacterium]|nr:peptidyl-prolyl cis-trans isomerase [Candidatus Cloacimonadota bacterium]